jgi:hypothetical protein
VPYFDLPRAAVYVKISPFSSQDLEAAANQDAKKTEGPANQIGDDAV